MVKWVIKAFPELTPFELQQCHILRCSVFVVEQNCPYQDADHVDEHCTHVMGWLENRVVAYTRILPPGLTYQEVSFGRVTTDQSFRGKGIGRVLMQQTLQVIQEQYPQSPVRISAQSYLQRFYESYGFQFTGKAYLEDNIPHIEMLLTSVG